MPGYDVDAEYRAAIRETTEWGDFLRIGLEPGIAGNGAGSVQVPGRAGWVYVRRPDSLDVFEARNRLGFSPVENDPLLLKKDKSRGYEIWEVVAVDIGAIVYAQVMFCVPGTLSIADDVAPWFICGAPDGINTLSAILSVKTAPGGGPVTCDIELSSDCGTSWESIFTIVGATLPNIPEGENCSPVFVFTFPVWIQPGDILRLNLDAVNGATDLTVSLRARQL